jgi:hypothetical protein
MQNKNSPDRSTAENNGKMRKLVNLKMEQEKFLNQATEKRVSWKK